ncbi:MAG TPA: hypothetical protein VF440_03230 [Novosphingobium sp.]
MDLLTTLHRSGGIVALARQLGAEPQAAAAAAERLLPILCGAFRAVQARAGIDGLLALLVERGGVDLAAEVMGVDQPDPARGTALLARLGVDRAEYATVLGDDQPADPLLLARMLPLLAMLAGGYLAGLELSRDDARAVLADLLDGGGDAASSEER